MASALREQPIIEYLYGIIDSKSQYIDYQLNAVINSSLNLGSQLDVKTITEKNIYLHTSKFENQLVFDKIVQFSKTKRLLLILRSMLELHNTEVVMELVTDNLFMYYSEKLLIQKLQNGLTKSSDLH